MFMIISFSLISVYFVASFIFTLFTTCMCVYNLLVGVPTYNYDMTKFLIKGGSLVFIVDVLNALIEGNSYFENLS